MSSFDYAIFLHKGGYLPHKLGEKTLSFPNTQVQTNGAGADETISIPAKLHKFASGVPLI